MCKRILFIVPSLAGGGTEKVLLNILRYLDREKFIPYLAVFDNEGEYLENVPRDIKVFDMKKRNRSGFFKMIFFLAFRILPEIKPDVIVSFLIYANLVALIAKRISFIKPLILINERNYPLRAEKKIKMIKIKKMLIKNMYPRADIIITVSNGIVSDLNKEYMIPKQKFQVIYNGVDIDSIRNIKKEAITDIQWFSNDVPVITTCGRLIYQKNYPLLLEAFTKAQKLVDLNLLFLGQGKDMDELKALVRHLGIEKKVLFMGFKKNPYKYMNASNIFILPSRWEGFPNVILEAMACGVPVISTGYPGVQEVINDGVDGIIVPTDDPDIMADRIVRLIRNKRLARHLINGGYRKINGLKIDKMVNRFEEVINTVSK